MKETMATIKEKISRGHVIVGAGVDSTDMEQLCSRAGCDLVLFYPTSQYHESENPFLAGYMPFGNSNNRMLEEAREMTTVVSGHHVFLGMNGSDPFLNKELLLKRFRQVHFHSVHNYPAMGLVDGYFKNNLDRVSLGFDREVETFRYAASKGFHICTMVRTKQQAAVMARAGADVIILYLGLGDERLSEDDNVRAVEKDIQILNESAETLRKLESDSVLLFHSEHVRTMDDVKDILHRTRGIHGYYLLPIARKDYPGGTLQEEIRQLKDMDLTG